MKRFSLTHIIPLLLAVFLLLPGQSHAQDYQQMRLNLLKKQERARNEIENLNSQINNFQKRLSQTEKKYDRIYKQYEDLKRIIALRDSKIDKLQNEQQHIIEEIDVTRDAVRDQQKQLDKLKQKYEKTLTYLYKHGRESQVALILTAGSINQMLVRAVYLRKFNDYLENQAEQVRKKRASLEQTREQLEEARDKNASVIKEIKQEKQNLAAKKEQQEKTVSLLKRDREKIRQKLGEVRQQKDKLNETLNQLIAEEERVRDAQKERMKMLEAERKRQLAAARKIADPDKRKTEMAKYSEPVHPENYLSESELDNISDAFAREKGDLPWPVDNGVITEKFGKRVDPVFGTTTMNPGVDISAEPRSPVHVIAEGYVFAVRPLPGFGDLVFVNHGRFKTVYGNLSEVSVRKNTYVEAGDVIGLSGDKDSAKGETVFFMIRENNKDLNPAAWLKDK